MPVPLELSAVSVRTWATTTLDLPRSGFVLKPVIGADGA
jgi:hypothetical protein